MKPAAPKKRTEFVALRLCLMAGNFLGWSIFLIASLSVRFHWLERSALIAVLLFSVANAIVIWRIHKARQKQLQMSESGTSFGASGTGGAE